VLAFVTRRIINAVLLVLTDKLTARQQLDGFSWALGGALMMSVLGRPASGWCEESSNTTVQRAALITPRKL